MASTIKAQVPGYIIERTAKRLKRAFQQTLTALKADITADQWVVLDLVRRTEGLSQRQIAQATAKDMPTVTRILDRLEDKSLVARRNDPADRRKFEIYPTAHGVRKVKNLLPYVEQFRLTHFEGLEEAEVQALLRILDKINDNITSSNISQHALSQPGKGTA
jgi:DNA-binding MarR family transcriptional regulator